MVIEFINVTKTIKGHKVIDNVNVKFESGKIIGLKGINGSGKTMLMRLACGLILPSEGTISIDGKILGKDITFPESVGILIENPAFLDGYSGFKNLKMLASIKNEIGDEQIRETIRRVGLDPDDRRPYRKYSLGMKQRLGIAAAIMEKPDIVLLDEPTNSLDISGVELLKDILRQERQRGALIIISSHDLDILQEVSDEIHVMERGRLVDHIVMEGPDKGVDK
ncbi:MAG: ABC transporter ATP-binding protein [Thermoanaerobacter sp.]|jgi:ABC-2 type transport system ATP-binding protein|uniref:ABC-2 type transport system ATP-binding protein n=1 Tax=Caldicoprobacter faecalis TaxID=937334 RepID=A0A1I5YKZ2_9FIRM|nr:ABC transporter ATP-binding protein [Caldicoprobacter faecalis]SFQ44765.1 ABC-2 type transport system ATP-binding protein [Caldicoprobacter faecalis]